MSYILEALRRSEQARGQSATASLLRAQATAVAQGEPARTPRGIHAALAVVFLAIGVGLGWWQPWSAPQTEPEIQLLAKQEAATNAVDALPEPKPVLPAPAAPLLSAPKPGPVAPLSSPPKTIPPPSVPVQSAAAPVRGTPARVAVQAASVQEKKISQKVAAPAEAVPSRERIYTPAELPQPLQEVLSSLAIRGFVYAADVPSRMVVINDRIFREGDEVVADLKIERIEPEAVMLTYKGYRIRAPK